MAKKRNSGHKFLYNLTYNIGQGYRLLVVSAREAAKKELIQNLGTPII
jgi:transcription termination factor Rho